MVHEAYKDEYGERIQPVHILSQKIGNFDVPRRSLRRRRFAAEEPAR